MTLLVALAFVPASAVSADAGQGLIGEGSSDDMSVTYTERQTGDSVLVITLNDVPSVRNVGVLVYSEEGHQKVSMIPTAKIFAVYIKDLQIGQYDVIVMNGQTETPIADCVLNVHERSSSTYVVMFDPNGGTGTMVPLTVTDGKVVLPENGFGAPSGMKFKEWSIDGSSFQPGAQVSITKDTTVHAVWESASSGLEGYILYIVIGILAVALIVVILILRRKV